MVSVISLKFLYTTGSKTYLDPKSDQYSPELYKYYKNNINVTPYKTDTGYGSIGQPSMNQYFSP